MTTDAHEIESMLADAARRFLDERHPPARARDADAGFRAALWGELAAMGWPALLLPEAAGGMGLGLAAAWTLAGEAGRHLLGVPLAANLAWLPGLRAARPEAALLDAWLAPVLAGQAYYAPAAAQADGTLLVEYAAPETLALALRRPAPDRIEIECHTMADAVIGTGLDPAIGTARIPGGAPVRRAALALDEAGWSRLCQGYRLLRSAELLGAAGAALDAAAAHARERQQFGRPIGANQAIKHKLADDWMALDDAGLAGRAAAQALDRDAPAGEAAHACAVAELLAVEAGRRAAENAIQVHGALGIAWECDMHLFLKRVLHIAGMLDSGRRRGELLDLLWRADGEDPAARASLAA